MQSNKFALGLLLVTALPLAAQNSAKPASVQGTVTNSISGAPVPRAHVSLQGDNEGKQVRYGATSAADGRFSFTGVAPGNYSVQADRVGFVTSQYGPPRERIAIMLQADDSKTGVDIRLVPTGAISGRVTDSDGEPVEGLSVQAQGPRGGDSDITDENGRYRLGGLAPGKYTVRTSQSDTFGGPPEIRTDGTTEPHNAATYYPGVLTQKEAGRVDVRAGMETPGGDIRLVRVPFVRVSGRVIDLPAYAHPDLMIEQAHDQNGARMKRDGTFVLWRLDPGKYKLAASWEAANGEEVRTVGVPIEVAGSNVDNIELRVVTDSEISGRLEFEDDSAKKLPGQADEERRITLTGEPEMGEGEVTATMDANGGFQLKKVRAGTYRVQVSWGNTYVKSVRLGATMFDGARLDLMNGSNGAELSVLMGAAKASISGTVQDSKGPAADLMVVLLRADNDADPDDEDMESGSENIVSTKTDGTYLFDHVAPGDYRILAVAQKEVSSRITGYQDQMETVTVGPDDKVTKDLIYRNSVP